jgi:hypothetical protein
MDTKLNCKVCLDIVDIPFSIKCGHTFCFNCIFNWLKSYLHCPFCRQSAYRFELVPCYMVYELVEDHNAKNTQRIRLYKNYSECFEEINKYKHRNEDITDADEEYCEDDEDEEGGSEES